LRESRVTAVMGGKPCIRGLRVTVGMLVGQIGAGRTPDELLADYPYLQREDIAEALRYAAWRAEEREILLYGRVSNPPYMTRGEKRAARRPASLFAHRIFNLVLGLIQAGFGIGGAGRSHCSLNAGELSGAAGDRSDADRGNFSTSGAVCN
jgi:uncharacterized protein (DUF433 family)